jgi:hypothetical protein
MRVDIAAMHLAQQGPSSRDQCALPETHWFACHDPADWSSVVRTLDRRKVDLRRVSDESARLSAVGEFSGAFPMKAPVFRLWVSSPARWLCDGLCGAGCADPALAAALMQVSCLFMPSCCTKHFHHTHHPRCRAAQPCVAQGPVTCLRRLAGSQQHPAGAGAHRPIISRGAHPLNVSTQQSGYDLLCPLLSGAAAPRSTTLNLLLSCLTAWHPQGESEPARRPLPAHVPRHRSRGLSRAWPASSHFPTPQRWLRARGKLFAAMLSDWPFGVGACRPTHLSTLGNSGGLAAFKRQRFEARSDGMLGDDCARPAAPPPRTGGSVRPSLFPSRNLCERPAAGCNLWAEVGCWLQSLFVGNAAACCNLVSRERIG